MATTVLTLEVWSGDRHLSTHPNLGPTVTIGRARNSDLCLEGIARSHAVLLKRHDGYYLEDMGSSLGTKLGKDFIEGTVRLPDKGEIQLGQWTLRFKIDPETDQDSRDRLRALRDRLEKARIRSWVSDAEHESEYQEATHHRTLLNSLVEELRRVAPDGNTATEHLPLLQSGWSLLPEEKRRQILRDLVHDIRLFRSAHKEIQERRVASFLNLGMTGIKGIFAMSPEDALEDARMHLTEITLAGQTLQRLAGLALDSNARQILGQGSEGQTMLEALQKGREALENSIKNGLVGSYSRLPLLLIRAGGYELTPQELADLEAMWAQIDKIIKPDLHVVN